MGAIKIKQYTITAGEPQPIQVAQGEDLQLLLTFLQGADSPQAGDPVDFTNAASGGVLLGAVDQSGSVIIDSRTCSVVDPPTSGVISAMIVGGDTSGVVPQTGQWNLDWTDTDGHREQVAVASPFQIVPNFATTGTPTPPPPPNPPGVNWRGAWSSIVAYAAPDGVNYPDPIGGASNGLSSFRAIAPSTNQAPIVANALNAAYWEYIAERGADGGAGLVSKVQRGNNGIGSLVLAGVKIGQPVQTALVLTGAGAGNDDLAAFEPTISVAGHIQQTNATDLSGVNVLFIVGP